MNILDKVRRFLSEGRYTDYHITTQEDSHKLLLKHLEELKDYCKEIKWNEESWEKTYDSMEEKLEGQIDELNTQLSDYEDTDEINKDLRQEVETLKEEVVELEGEIYQQEDLIPDFRHVHDKMAFEEMVREFKDKYNYHG